MAADSGMDTCPSPENADSRKRPLDGDAENGDTKRSHFSSDKPHSSKNDSQQDTSMESVDNKEKLAMSEYKLPNVNEFENFEYKRTNEKSNGSYIKLQWLLSVFISIIGGDGTHHFKVLVPSAAAGAIIGKGGETIAQLQKDTGARVKMSKSHDFYPGTTERVCLITGTVDAIMAVNEFIMDKIREKPEVKQMIEGDIKPMQERDRQVKILVPNSTAGMIIGKAGNFIKQIKETSGSYVQISQKSKDVSLQERCITVIGDKEQNKEACLMIISKIVEDPQSGTCLNVSYADVNGPVANFNPTGSPFAHNGSGFNTSTTSLNSSMGSNIMLNGGLNMSLNLAQPGQGVGNVTAQLMDHIKVQLRSTGYTDSHIAEIATALTVLAKYGILGMGLGLGATHGALPVSSYLSVMEQTGATGTNTSAMFGAIGQVTLGDCLGAATTPSNRQSLERYEAAFDPFRHQASAATAPISLNNNSFGLGTGQQMTVLSKSPTPAELNGSKDSKNVEIPEVIVGAILGPGGRSLIEIQQMSGANIQISKKGIFAPGTRNRIVTITGNPHSIHTATYLIEQRISDEEMKRARNNGGLGIGPLAMQ